MSKRLNLKSINGSLDVDIENGEVECHLENVVSESKITCPRQCHVTLNPDMVLDYELKGIRLYDCSA